VPAVSTATGTNIIMAVGQLSVRTGLLGTYRLIVIVIVVVVAAAAAEKK